MVREGENSNIIARAFARKFELNQETETLLRDQIEQNLAQLATYASRSSNQRPKSVHS